MSIRRKVRSVENLFRELDLKIEMFKQQTQLGCVGGCGFCCNKPDVEATVLEFLPLAYFYFVNDLAEKMLVSLGEHQSPVCHVFRKGSTDDAGFCTLYAHRGLICRLFGFSARRNKYGEPEFTTCRKIKENHPEKYIDAYLAVKGGMKIPGMRDYYQRLQMIDFELAQQTYPINTALRKAIELVLSHYAYRKKPRNKPANDHMRGTIPSPGLSQDLISGPQ